MGKELFGEKAFVCSFVGWLIFFINHCLIGTIWQRSIEFGKINCIDQLFELEGECFI